jgi:hypothetical protein
MANGTSRRQGLAGNTAGAEAMQLCRAGNDSVPESPFDRKPQPAVIASRGPRRSKGRQYSSGSSTVVAERSASVMTQSFTLVRGRT